MFIVYLYIAYNSDIKQRERLLYRVNCIVCTPFVRPNRIYPFPLGMNDLTKGAIFDFAIKFSVCLLNKKTDCAVLSPFVCAWFGCFDTFYRKFDETSTLNTRYLFYCHCYCWFSQSFISHWNLPCNLSVAITERWGKSNAFAFEPCEMAAVLLTRLLVYARIMCFNAIRQCLILNLKPYTYIKPYLGIRIFIGRCSTQI